jgi:pantoate--beta-alanine ligase
VKIIKTVSQLQKEVQKLRKQGKSIGFTPTLGALHAGHITLVDRMLKENDIGIVSIYVNPTQFNVKSDLAKYPRTLEADAKKLKKAKLDILFAPNNTEVYPKGLRTKVKIDFKGLDKRMEGKFRDGHFEGVCQVVKRLLDIVTPDSLYMGQKDFQQFTIIQHMINVLKMPVKLVVCDIVREKHGLAMSSRNERLSKKAREEAALIHKTLKWIKRNRNKYSIAELKAKAMDKLSPDGFKPEYVSIVNGHTLRGVRKMDAHDYVVVCTAVWTEDVRLIDNVVVKK